MRASIALLLLSAVARSAGYNCLFIGHSFFVPIANKLIPLAASAGVTHTHNEVFSGGATGVPSALWQKDEKRNEAQGARRRDSNNTHARRHPATPSTAGALISSARLPPAPPHSLRLNSPAAPRSPAPRLCVRLFSAAILDGGDIELFGMTLDVGTGADGGGSISTDSYERWIDYALSKNPSTIIMIGAPWADFPSDYDTPSYTTLLRGGFPTLMTGVTTALRAKYPNTTIIENPYGLGVVEARLLFEAGGLPDVTSLFGCCANDETGRSSCGEKLFNDQKGHGGDFLKALAALIWLDRIYGVDLSTYESPEIAAFGTNITAVAKAVLDRFDAGDLCGAATCSACNVTTPCGVPPSDAAKGDSCSGGGGRVGIIVGSVVGALAFLALLGLGIYCWRRRSGGAQAKGGDADDGGGKAITATTVSVAMASPPA